MTNQRYKPPFGFTGPSPQGDGEDDFENPYKEGTDRWKKWESEHLKNPQKQVGGYGSTAPEEPREEEDGEEESDEVDDSASGYGNVERDDVVGNKVGNPYMYNREPEKYKAWNVKHGLKPTAGLGGRPAVRPESIARQQQQNSGYIERVAGPIQKATYPLGEDEFGKQWAKKTDEPTFIPNLPDDAQITITVGQLKELLQQNGV